MDWLYKATLTATTVALLLTVARLWGRWLAGVLTGLPTITAPALLWLAVAQGSDSAVEAGRGALAAGAVCAVFALAYTVASDRLGPARALAAACLAGLVPVAVLWQWRPDLPVLVAVILLTCLACTTGVGRRRRSRTGGRQEAETTLRRGPGQAASVALQALVAGSISGVVAAWGHDLGAYAAGAISSLPLVAAAVAVWLHGAEGGDSIAPFLHGYLTGLYGRSLFVVVFCLLVVPVGAAIALAVAGGVLLAALLLVQQRPALAA